MSLRIKSAAPAAYNSYLNSVHLAPPVYNLSYDEFYSSQRFQVVTRRPSSSIYVGKHSNAVIPVAYHPRVSNIGEWNEL